MKRLSVVSLAAAALACTGSGCGHPAASGSNFTPPKMAAANPPASSSTNPPKAPSAAATDVDLQKFKVNEAGKIMILEYHNIRVGRTDYDRTPDALRKDLDTLYKEGYRPISMRDYLDNRIDVPLGKTPVILTFDDSSPTQFHYLKDGSVDPDCAYGILTAFHAVHPDFALRALFYMNASPNGRPSPVFGDPATSEKKTRDLLAAGMEVGNHTVTHPKLSHLSDAAVQKELADCVAGIHALAPDAVVDTLALPFGIWPKNRALAEEGEADGVKYHNRAVLKVGAEPAPAPAAVKFRPLSLPRIQAVNKPSGSDYWLEQMRRHPRMRYISDGDPGTITVPMSAEQNIDSAKLGQAKLRTYAPAETTAAATR